MPRIFDNIDNELLPFLLKSLENSNSADFCVGFFNLRGWRLVDEPINQWEGKENSHCRVLVGMNKLPYEELREALKSEESSEIPDQKAAFKLKQKCADSESSC
jgi:hypothetical protein